MYYLRAAGVPVARTRTGRDAVKPDTHEDRCQTYLEKLCEEIGERPVGSDGNRAATRFFADTVRSFGWDAETPEFTAMDWQDGGATLRAGDEGFDVLVSPYSLGCGVTAPLVCASTAADFEALDCGGRILLLHGEIASEQIMPKNFVFYNPEHHQEIVRLLEERRPAAVACATGRNAALAGGVYPFPLFEDGDFDVPSVYMTEEEGRRLLRHAGEAVTLRSISRRIPGTACNVVARKGRGEARIVVTAHIDAKKGTPGAIDNATGVVILLLLAELLADYPGGTVVELVALNGEDYYGVPGQMDYINRNRDAFHEILLNINIDGAGYREGPSAYSFYELPDGLRALAVETFAHFSGLTEGPAWPQGDHGIFLFNGRPAIALSSLWFTSNIDSQEITHTPADNLGIVDTRKVVEIARALDAFVRDAAG